MAGRNNPPSPPEKRAVQPPRALVQVPSLGPPKRASGAAQAIQGNVGATSRNTPQNPVA